MFMHLLVGFYGLVRSFIMIVDFWNVVDLDAVRGPGEMIVSCVQISVISAGLKKV